MWSTLLGFAFLFAINPVLLAIIVLMVSRPRPVQNLLAYWAGSVMVTIPCLLVPLLVLDATFRADDVASPATNSVVRYFQLGMSVLALALAVLMIVRGARQRAQVPVPVGAASGPEADSDPPNPVASPFGRASDTPIEGASVFRRLLSRLQKAWEDGALWVAFVFGLGGFPPPPVVLFVGATIMAAGVPTGTQVLAVVVFVVAMFAVIEITLVSYLVAPTKTLAVLRPMHDWALAHRRQILIALFAVGGSFGLAHSLGIV
ncbi:GAP family protein [Mycolicibacterium sp. XJ870]